MVKNCKIWVNNMVVVKFYFVIEVLNYNCLDVLMKWEVVCDLKISNSLSKNCLDVEDLYYKIVLLSRIYMIISLKDDIFF